MKRLLSYLLAAVLAVAPVLSQAQVIRSYPPTTANTTLPFSDSSNLIATNQFVQGRAALGNSSTPFAGITGGTYSFATLGSGAIIVFTASGGVLSGIITIGLAGSGYAVGDVLTPMGGNADAYVRVTGVSGGGVTSAQILYGGTGYNTGGSLQLSPAQTFPKVFSASGTLASNVTVIIPNGTFLLGSQERTVFNNTTGAFTTTLCVSNGSNACTGTTLLVPQGSSNSTPISWFTDGSTGVWQTNNAAGAGAGSLTGTNVWSGSNTFNNNDFKLAGSSSGTTTVNASAVASGTLTLPAATDQLVGRATTDTLTNKTLSGSTLAGVTLFPTTGEIDGSGNVRLGTASGTPGTSAATAPLTVGAESGTSAVLAAFGQFTTNSPKQLIIQSTAASNFIDLQALQQGVGFNQTLRVNGGGGRVLVGTNTDNGTDELQVAGSINGSTFLGLGATGTTGNPINIANATNSFNLVQITDNNAGTITRTGYSANNGTNFMALYQTGAGFTPVAVIRQDASVLTSNASAGGLTLATGAAQPIYFAINNTEALRIDANRHQVTSGPTPTCGAGCSSVAGNDNAFVVTTGTAQTSIAVNFGASWGANPVCNVSSNSTASVTDISAVATGSITFGASVALTGALLYVNCRQ